MRPSFEKNLGEYSQLAKDQMATEDVEELEKLQEAVDLALQHGAMSQKVKKEKQAEVFEIQEEKQRIMQRLKENLRCLDDQNCTPERPPESRLVTYNEKENSFFVQMLNGKQELATLGDILTDGDWGLVYYLDPQTIPRMTQKKFFVESAKRELRDLLDEQIVISSPHRKPEVPGSILTHKRRVGQAYNFKELNSKQKNALLGFMAEISVKTFFQQLYVNKLIPFRVIDADVYQDAVEKIDFIIHIQKHKRGVGVEADDKVKNIAIQFTARSGKGMGTGKMRKINEIRDKLIKAGIADDIILIKFPIKALLNYYQKWQNDDMPPGGPFQYGTIEIRRNLFYKVLENVSKIRPEIKTEKLWQEIEPSLQVREAGDSD